MAQNLAKPPQNSSSSSGSGGGGGGGGVFSGHNKNKIPLKQNKNCSYLFYLCPNESACFCFPQAGWMKFMLVPSISKACTSATLLLSVRS